MNQISRFLVLPLGAPVCLSFRGPVCLLTLTCVLENSQEGARESHITSQLLLGSFWALASRPVPEAAEAGGSISLQTLRSREQSVEGHNFELYSTVISWISGSCAGQCGF